MKINTTELGKRIAKRRRAQKMKQEELAGILDISNNHLSSIERGRAVPSMTLFCGICDALSVTPDYLLLGDMRSNNVPQDIMDLLRLCSDDQIASCRNLCNSCWKAVLKKKQMTNRKKYDIIQALPFGWCLFHAYFVLR